jgi:hypothetical protein
MDTGTFLSIIKRLVQSIRLFFEIVGIVQTILWLIGGGAVIGGVIASLQKMPISVAIALFTVALVALGYAIVKTIYRYRRWSNLKNIPELDDVLKKALDIHIHIGELHDIVIEQNKRKNIKTKTREALAEKFLETLQIPLSELVNGINPDGTMKKKLYRKIRRLFDLKEGNYFTALPLLADYGHLLDRSKLGLRDAIQASTKYDQLKNEFMKSQLGLNVPSKTINNINTLPELSYGLNSVSVGISLVNKGRTWYKYVPNGYIKQKEQSKDMLDTAYLTASMWVKNRVKLAMFEEALK